MEGTFWKNVISISKIVITEYMGTERSGDNILLKQRAGKMVYIKPILQISGNKVTNKHIIYLEHGIVGISIYIVKYGVIRHSSILWADFM